MSEENFAPLELVGEYRPLIEELACGISAMKVKSVDAQRKGVQPTLGSLKKFFLNGSEGSWGTVGGDTQDSF